MKNFKIGSYRASTDSNVILYVSKTHFNSVVDDISNLFYHDNDNLIAIKAHTNNLYKYLYVAESYSEYIYFYDRNR